MSLPLGFPDIPLELTVSRKPSLEAVVARFRAANQEPDSAVRAVRHQPATEGIFAEMPAAVDPRLRAALERGLVEFEPPRWRASGLGRRFLNDLQAAFLP